MNNLSDLDEKRWKIFNEEHPKVFDRVIVIWSDGDEVDYSSKNWGDAKAYMIWDEELYPLIWRYA